jgi:glutathione S-transferase
MAVLPDGQHRSELRSDGAFRPQGREDSLCDRALHQREQAHLGREDKQLGKFEYLAGPAYTIADIAAYAWVNVAQRLHFPDLGQWPQVQRWFEQVGARPAVRKGVATPELER